MMQESEISGFWASGKLELFALEQLCEQEMAEIDELLAEHEWIGEAQELIYIRLERED